MNCSLNLFLTIILGIAILAIIYNYKLPNINPVVNINSKDNKDSNDIHEGFITSDEEKTINDNNLLIKNKLDTLKENQAKLLNKEVNNSIISNIEPINKYLTIDTTQDNTQIDNLNKQVGDLENIIYNYKKENATENEVTKIKSLNNGLELDLTKTPNTYFSDPVSGLNQAAHLVNVNCGCLSVGTTDYDIYKCDDKNAKQYFKIQNILNETDYSKNIDLATPFDSVDKSKIQYPFALIKSLNNGNCLTNNHGQLTVQPCHTFTAQRWIPM